MLYVYGLLTGCQTVYTQGILTNEWHNFESDVIVNQTITGLTLTIFKKMNHKVPISSSVFGRVELSVQNNLSAVRMVWAIHSSQPFKRLELSVQKDLSAFGTVRAVLFKKIRQPFQLSVGKNKTVTSSCHWKVKCCEWSLCGEVFMSFRKYCRGMSQLRSTQLFTCAKTFHRVEYSWLLTASHHD